MLFQAYNLRQNWSIETQNSAARTNPVLRIGPRPGPPRIGGQGAKTLRSIQFQANAQSAISGTPTRVGKGPGDRFLTPPIIQERIPNQDHDRKPSTSPGPISPRIGEQGAKTSRAFELPDNAESTNPGTPARFGKEVPIRPDHGAPLQRPTFQLLTLNFQLLTLTS